MWKIKKNDDGSYEIFDDKGRAVGKYADADMLAMYLAFSIKKIRDMSVSVASICKEPGVVQWIKQDGTPLERKP